MQGFSTFQPVRPGQLRQESDAGVFTAQGTAKVPEGSVLTLDDVKMRRVQRRAGYRKDGIVHRIGTPEGMLFEYVPSKAAVANGSAASSTPVRRSETPLQRYTRLYAEMKELSSDLALLGVAVTPVSESAHVQPPSVPSSKDGSDSTHTSNPAAPPAAPTRSTATLELTDALRAEDAVLPDVAEALGSLQQHLLGWGAEAVTAAKNSNKNRKSRSNKSSALDSAQKAAALPEVEVPEAPPTGDIAPPAPPSGFISHEEAAELEAHIARLEARLWGDVEDDSGVPLAKRIMDIQEQARVADPKVLESATQQAKIFAAQMQAMPQGAGGGAEGGDGGVSPAQLDEAIALLTKWDGVRAALPSVVSRMESLAELHAAAAHFHHRLSALEQGGTSLRTALAQNALVMSSLKESLLHAATKNTEHGGGGGAAPDTPLAPRERSGSASSGASNDTSSSSGSDSASGSGSDSEDGET